MNMPIFGFPGWQRSESFCSDVTVRSPTIFNNRKDGDVDNTDKCKAVQR